MYKSKETSERNFGSLCLSISGIFLKIKNYLKFKVADHYRWFVETPALIASIYQGGTKKFL